MIEFSNVNFDTFKIIKVKSQLQDNMHAKDLCRTKHADYKFKMTLLDEGAAKLIISPSGPNLDPIRLHLTPFVRASHGFQSLFRLDSCQEKGMTTPKIG